MRDHYHTKARAILADTSRAAGILRTRVNEALKAEEISATEAMFLEQDAIRNQLLAALSYALMGVPGPINISEVNVSAPDEEPQGEEPHEPEDEPEPDPIQEVFAALDDTIAFMRSASPLLQYFTGHTTKDTPQA